VVVIINKLLGVLRNHGWLYDHEFAYRYSQHSFGISSICFKIFIPSDHINIEASTLTLTHCTHDYGVIRVPHPRSEIFPSGLSSVKSVLTVTRSTGEVYLTNPSLTPVRLECAA